MYDENGEPFGFSFGGNDYYYVRNAQNDIYLIVDSNNQAVVIYQYDAWGNITNCYDISTNDIVSTLNTYTYRGYFRDSETGLYYLKSRYYFPEFHRFICADNAVSTVGGKVVGYNLFSYCFNNPINFDDSNGNWPKWVTGTLNILSGVSQIVAGVALGATVGWTGVGAVAAGFLIANGSATTISGAFKIHNYIHGSNWHEENIIKTGAKAVGGLIGRAIGGKSGENTGRRIGAVIYNISNIAATVYSIVGGSITGLSKTTGMLSKTGTVTKESFSMLTSSSFFNEYSVSVGMGITKFVDLPKGWFRASNVLGAFSDTALTLEELIDLFSE